MASFVLVSSWATRILPPAGRISPAANPSEATKPA